MAAKVLRAHHDAGHPDPEIVDQLVIEGTVDGIFEADPETGDPTNELAVVRAYGWVSATTNHYDAKHYDSDGNLTSSAKSREMTKKEVTAYCERLLLEQNPVAEDPAPTADRSFLVGSAPAES